MIANEIKRLIAMTGGMLNVRNHLIWQYNDFAIVGNNVFWLNSYYATMRFHARLNKDYKDLGFRVEWLVAESFLNEQRFAITVYS